MPINMNSKDNTWIDKGWRTADSTKDSGQSEVKLLSVPNIPCNFNDPGTDYAEVDTQNLTTFYNKRVQNFKHSIYLIDDIVQHFINVYLSFP